MKTLRSNAARIFAIPAIVVCVLTFCLLPTLPAADPVLRAASQLAPPTPAPPPTGSVTCIDIHGVPTTGLWDSWRGEKVSLLTGPPIARDTVKKESRELVSLSWKHDKLPGTQRHPQVWLANGDRLALRWGTLDAEALTASWAAFRETPSAWKPVQLPLEAVTAWVLQPPADAAGRTRLLNRLSDRKQPVDIVILNNGDTLSGELQGGTAQRLTLKTAIGETHVDLAGVSAIGFNPELTSFVQKPGDRYLVVLTDGSRFQATRIQSTQRSLLTCDTVFGITWEIPLSAVAAIHFRHERVLDLSDLEPAEYRFQPYLALTWPWRKDRSVLGGPLLLRGEEFPKGIGVHSQSTLTYRLDGKYRWFQTTIGIDDDALGKGSVVFQILKDDTPAYTSDIVTGDQPPLTLDRLDVTGTKTLTLRVTYATLGDIQDHANWGLPILIK